MKAMPAVAMLIFTILLTATGASATPVRVLTYNLMGMKPGTDPDTRIQHIIENLRQLDPDIIGLQEINETLDGEGNQAQIIADSLASHFGNEYHVYMEFTHQSWDNQFREYVGIISKHPVLEEGFGQLVAGVFPRKVVWNAIDSPLGRLNVFNTHLSFNSADVRKLQVQQIIGFITYTENLSPGVASILVGDFNDEPDSEAIRLLTEPGAETFYIDTYAFSNPNDPGYTVPSSSPTARIDFVFEKSTGSLAIDTSMVVIDEPYDGTDYCSDHLGVLTIFQQDLTNSQIHGEKPSFSLRPLRPNPSTGHVLIPYMLTGEAAISLAVYTITGQRVAELLSGARPAGLYRAIWDGSDDRGSLAPSGSYVVRLEVDSGTMERPLSLVR
jgi:endonuclease/exonuclease/phosphatase family metal-dependent hydrolase